MGFKITNIKLPQEKGIKGEECLVGLFLILTQC